MDVLESTSPGKTAISRRELLKACALLGTAGAGSLLGVSLYEPHELKVERIEVWLRRLPSPFDGLRLVQLSDIHFADHMTEWHLRRIVQTTNSLRPDLIVLTGDFVTAPLFSLHGDTKAAEKAWPCAEVLKGLHAPLGRAAVLGNHDHYSRPDVVTIALETNGFVVLRNQSLPIEIDGSRLWLAGVDDAIEKKADVNQTLKRIPAGECIVAAVHEPDLADKMCRYPIDLQVSGHTHGGQVRFPVVGPLYLPSMGRKYVSGYYRVGPLQLYTNRGVGVVRLPVRFLCPPEVTVITLRSASNS